jgi:phosphate transport system substrate-binding protein
LEETTVNRIKAKTIATIGLTALLVSALVATAGGVYASPSLPLPPEWPPVLRVYGSTTIDPIAIAAKSPFEARWPGTAVTVGAPGSGFGIRALLLDRVDVAMSSRMPDRDDVREVPLGTPGMDPHRVYHIYTIARDALSIIVRDVPAMAFLTTITREQIRFIWMRGEAIVRTTWHDVDMVDGRDDWTGDGHLVIPRARFIGSGTRDAFHALVGAIAPATEKITITATGLPRLEHSKHVVAAIAANTFHVGYVGLGFIGKPGIRAVPVEGVMPSKATVLDGTYPMSRPLFLLTLRDDPTPNARADDFINYMLSAAGQAHVAATGFVPVPPVVPAIHDADVNKDKLVGLLDMLAVFGAWGRSDPHHDGWIREDVNNDRLVGLLDMLAIFAAWGWTPPAR